MAERIPVELRGDVPACPGCGCVEGRPGDAPSLCLLCEAGYERVYNADGRLCVRAPEAVWKWAQGNR